MLACPASSMQHGHVVKQGEAKACPAVTSGAAADARWDAFLRGDVGSIPGFRRLRSSRIPGWDAARAVPGGSSGSASSAHRAAASEIDDEAQPRLRPANAPSRPRGCAGSSSQCPDDGEPAAVRPRLDGDVTDGSGSDDGEPTPRSSAVDSVERRPDSALSFPAVPAVLLYSQRESLCRRRLDELAKGSEWVLLAPPTLRSWYDICARGDASAGESLVASLSGVVHRTRQLEVGVWTPTGWIRFYLDKFRLAIAPRKLKGRNRSNTLSRLLTGFGDDVVVLCCKLPFGDEVSDLD